MKQRGRTRKCSKFRRNYFQVTSVGAPESQPMQSGGGQIEGLLMGGVHGGDRPALEGLHGGRVTATPNSVPLRHIHTGRAWMAERTVGAVPLAGQVGWGESSRQRPSQERD